MEELINISFGGSLDGKIKAISKVYCDNKDNCKSYKEGKCICGSGFNHKNWLFGKDCPHVRVVNIEGKTAPQRRKIEAQKSDLQREYPKLIDVLKDDKRGIVNIGDGYIINIAFIDDNIIKRTGKEETLGKVIQNNVVKKENWNKNTIIQIMNFRPMALVGGVIDTYEQKELPKFVRALKEIDKKMFDEIAKDNDLSEYLEVKHLLGKKAYLKTLSKGKVRLSVLENIEWDGEKLKGTGDEFSIWGLKEERVEITPNDDTVVEVIDENTINENTRWVE